MSPAVRKSVFIIAIIILLIQPFVMNSFFSFIFAGVVPGTTIVLPFWAMSLFLASIGYIAIKSVSKETLFVGDTAHKERQAKANAKRYVLQKVTPATKKQQPRFAKLLPRRRKRSYRVATS